MTDPRLLPSVEEHVRDIRAAVHTDRYQQDMVRARDLAIAEAVREACVHALPALKGQPKRYNWAQQNLNSGHDQAVHAADVAIRALDLADVLGDKNG